ncbi:hypothetical protein D3C74_158420 [compost metagenome]
MRNTQNISRPDPKIETLSMISNLMEANDIEFKLNLITSFGTIQGSLACYNPKNKFNFDLKSMMDGLVDETSDLLEEPITHDFIVLNEVILTPFSYMDSKIEYKQLVIYVDQIVAFNFV